MSSSVWSKVKLGEVINFKNGKKRPDGFGSIPVYGGNGILGFTNDFNFKNIVIIGRVGAYCGSVYFEPGICWISDNAISAKPINNNSVKYAYYVLKSLQLNERRIGTGQPLLTQSILNNIDTFYPGIDEQEAIAATLSCLDDKIELNSKINKNLEEMAQAIFKSWFVDFEPFQDGEFEESELGKIPKGWRVGVLDDVAYITMGQSPKGSSYNENKEGKVFYQGRTDFGSRFPKVRLYTSEPKRMASKGDVLLSVRAPVGDVNVAYEDCCIGRGLASFRSKNSCSSFLLYLLLNLKERFDVYNGEGTVFGSVTKDTLNNIQIIIPKEDIILQFQKNIQKLDNYIEINSIQNRTLQALRDSLLPKLMSGEIRVPVEEVQ